MLVGVDVSKWNLGWNPDNAIRPIGFVIQRVSYSVLRDSGFVAMREQVNKIPIRGAYHYYSSDVDWRKQAEVFLSAVEEGDYHFLAVDYEKTYNTLDQKSLSDMAEMVDYLKAYSCKKVLVYFNLDVFNTVIAHYGYLTWANNQDVWYAQYPFTSSENITWTSPVLPPGLKTWRIWQYGDRDVNTTDAGQYYGGGLEGIDLNYFNGEEADMRAWCGSSAVSAPLPKPEYKLTGMVVRK